MIASATLETLARQSLPSLGDVPPKTFSTSGKEPDNNYGPIDVCTGLPRDFWWTTSPNAHTIRRHIIMNKYPEVETLFGNDIWQGVLCTITIIVQMVTCYLVHVMDPRFPCLLLLTYCISATLNHSLFLAMHELCHCNFWPSKWMNEYYSLLTNIPMGVPAAITFRRYHLDHHMWLGVDGLDPDIPTAFEGQITTSKLRKLIWVLFIVIPYSLRPMFRFPKKMKWMDKLNWAFILLTDVLVFHFWGWKSLFYILAGTMLSMGLHPLNGHFIAEHFLFPTVEPYQETVSYYGIANWITYNVGYHNEHHDFPRIPGSRLPKLKMIAKEFYDLPHYTSWCKVMWDFVMTDSVGCYSRVKRVTVKGGSVTVPHTVLHDGVIPDTKYWMNYSKDSIAKID